MLPMEHKVNKSFAYVNSQSTDIRKTFARVRAEMAALTELPKVKVTRMRKPGMKVASV